MQRNQAERPRSAQLQEGSFRTITVITEQTLTWAAAAGCRWTAIKPLPPHTPQGLTFQQTAVNPAPPPPPSPKAALLPNPRWICVIPARSPVFITRNVSLERVIQPSPGRRRCKVAKRHKQGRGGGVTKLERRLSNQRRGAPGPGCLENTASQSAGVNGRHRWGEGSAAALEPESGPPSLTSARFQRGAESIR